MRSSKLQKEVLASTRFNNLNGKISDFRTRGTDLADAAYSSRDSRVMIAGEKSHIGTHPVEVSPHQPLHHQTMAPKPSSKSKLRKNLQGAPKEGEEGMRRGVAPGSDREWRFHSRHCRRERQCHLFQRRGRAKAKCAAVLPPTGGDPRMGREQLLPRAQGATERLPRASERLLARLRRRQTRQALLLGQRGLRHPQLHGDAARTWRFWICRSRPGSTKSRRRTESSVSGADSPLVAFHEELLEDRGSERSARRPAQPTFLSPGFALPLREWRACRQFRTGGVSEGCGPRMPRHLDQPDLVPAQAAPVAADFPQAPSP